MKHFWLRVFNSSPEKPEEMKSTEFLFPMYGFVQIVYIVFLFLLELFVLRVELCTFVVVGVASLKIMVLRQKR